MRPWKTERLGTYAAGDVVHAAYPSALTALCGVKRDQLSHSDVGATGPSCGECRAAAAHIDAIDRSAPATWFRGAAA